MLTLRTLLVILSMFSTFPSWAQVAYRYDGKTGYKAGGVFIGTDGSVSSSVGTRTFGGEDDESHQKSRNSDINFQQSQQNGPYEAPVDEEAKSWLEKEIAKIRDTFEGKAFIGMTVKFRGPRNPTQAEYSQKCLKQNIEALEKHIPFLQQKGIRTVFVELNRSDYYTEVKEAWGLREGVWITSLREWVLGPDQNGESAPWDQYYFPISTQYAVQDKGMRKDGKYNYMERDDASQNLWWNIKRDWFTYTLTCTLVNNWNRSSRTLIFKGLSLEEARARISILVKKMKSNERETPLYQVTGVTSHTETDSFFKKTGMESINVRIKDKWDRLLMTPAVFLRIHAPVFNECSVVVNKEMLEGQYSFWKKQN